MEKMKKNLVKVMMLFFIFIMTAQLATYAAEIKPENRKRSEQYEEWLNLSEEEQADKIAPLPFSIIPEQKSGFNAIVAQFQTALSIPAQYDLRTVLKDQSGKSLIEVKNQGQTGTCWAQSANSALETTILNKNKTIPPYNFSEMHIEYQTVNEQGRILNQGGNFFTAGTYWANGRGPIIETDIPSQYQWSTTTLPNVTPAFQVEDYEFLGTIYKKKVGSQIVYTDGGSYTYSSGEVAQIRNQIKSHIMTYGAVYTTCNIQTGIGQDLKPYTNDPAFSGPNHAVTIIGWDDTYNNFPGSDKPVNQGAYLILNSWGEEMGDGGYYWVSYDDTYIEAQVGGVIKVGDVNYDKIYQYDTKGMNTSVILGTSSTDKWHYVANVFQKGAGTEVLNKIGIFTLDSQQIEVYIKQDGNGSNISSGLTKVNVKKTQLQPGYNTIELQTPIQLTGQSFIVAVRILNDPWICFAQNPTQTSGKSYIGSDLVNWQDISATPGFSNYAPMIKAYTGSGNPTQKYTVSYNANGGSNAPTGQQVTSGTAITLPAKGTMSKSYTVTFNANGGSVSPTSKTLTCSLAGWNLNSQSGQLYLTGASYTVASNVTFYAKWNSPTIGTLPTPTGSGVFKGWYTAATGGTKVTEGTVIDSNTTVYAQWEEYIPGQYIVSYNANGGSSAPGGQQVISGTIINLPAKGTMSKSYTVTFNANGGSVSPTSKTLDCSLAGWNLNSQSGQLYLAGASYTVTSNTTFYAKWNDPAIGTLPTPIGSGVFKGWYTAATGGTKITEGTVIDSNTTVYAQWEGSTPEQYIISYNANGGSNAPANQQVALGSVITLPAKGTMSKIYTITFNANGGSISPGSKTLECPLAGWNLNSQSGQLYLTGASYTVTNNVTFYAKWNNPTIGTLPTPIPPAGKKFIGWTTSSSGGTAITQNYSIQNNTTIYAQYIDAEEEFEIGSGKYDIDEEGAYIIVSQPGETKVDFLENIDTENGVTKEVKKDGQIVQNTALIGTEMDLVVTKTLSGGGTYTAQYKIIVKGDLDGDGKTSAAELLAVKRHLISSSKPEWILNGIKFIAIDLKGDGNIDASVLLEIKRMVLKQM